MLCPQALLQDVEPWLLRKVLSWGPRIDTTRGRLVSFIGSPEQLVGRAACGRDSVQELMAPSGTGRGVSPFKSMLFRMRAENSRAFPRIEGLITTRQRGLRKGQRGTWHGDRGQTAASQSVGRERERMM